MTEVLTYPGSWPDCDGALVAFLRDGRVRTTSPLMPEREAPPNPVGLRCALFGDKPGVALVDGSRDVAVYRDDLSPQWHDLGRAIGQRPVEIRAMETGFTVWVVDSEAGSYAVWSVRYGVRIEQTGAGAVPLVDGTPSSQGIQDSPQGLLWWMDSHRVTDGLLEAMRKDGLTVGQRPAPPGSPDALESRWRGGAYVVREGLVRGPRLTRLDDGHYRVVGMRDGGQILQVMGPAPLGDPLGAPSLPPDPDPPAAPDPPAPLSGGIMIDLDRVRWLHADIRRWPVQGQVNAVRFRPDELAIEHTLSSRLPDESVDGVLLEGNPWVFAQIDGQWYAATYEWLRPDQTWKGIHASNIGAHIKREPMQSWRPRDGETVGFCVSGFARDSRRNAQIRTDVVVVRWGSGIELWREGATAPGPMPVPEPPADPGNPGTPAPSLEGRVATLEAVVQQLATWARLAPR